MSLPKIVELVTKKEIPALQRYLIFEVSYSRSSLAAGCFPVKMACYILQLYVTSAHAEWVLSFFNCMLAMRQTTVCPPWCLW